MYQCTDSATTPYKFYATPRVAYCIYVENLRIGADLSALNVLLSSNKNSYGLDHLIRSLPTPADSQLSRLS